MGRSATRTTGTSTSKGCNTRRAGSTTTLVNGSTYDNANRIATFTDTAGKSQGFGYDTYNNVHQTSAPGILPQQQLLPQGSNYYDASSNRIAGDGYDEAGRPNHEPANTSRRMRWDAEGRLVELTPSVGKVRERYAYDGNGLRIRRTLTLVEPTTEQTTHFVYDANGELMAEYPTGASVSYVAGNPRYLITDHLGSVRVVTDHQGTVLARRDYLPFGSNNVRTADGYQTATDVRQRFAGSERDLVGAENDSYNDFMQARYLAGTLARFYTPDEVGADQDVGDPASWNLYTYARNNPIVLSDPSGRKCVDGVDDENGEVCFVTEGTAKRPEDPKNSRSFIDYWSFAMRTAIGGASAGTSRVLEYAEDWMSRPRDPGCMARTTAAYGGGAAIMGGAAGSLGFSLGPLGTLTTAGGIQLGGASGLVIGNGIGLISCMQGSGSGGGAGGGQSGGDAWGWVQEAQIRPFR